MTSEQMKNNPYLIKLNSKVDQVKHKLKESIKEEKDVEPLWMFLRAYEEISSDLYNE